MVQIHSILVAILAGNLIQLAAGQANPHNASHVPIIKGHWDWNNTRSKELDVSLALPSRLLFQNPLALWPVHTTILNNLVRNLVEGQKRLKKLVPASCNVFDPSIEKWQALVDGQKPIGKTLTRAKYFEALHALRAATYSLKTTCHIQRWWLPLVQAPTFEVLMDNILLIGLIHDASGWDSMPSFLNDLPWMAVRDLIEITNIDVEKKFSIWWQDEEI